MRIEVIDKSLVIPLKLKNSEENIYVGKNTVIPGGSDSIDPENLRLNLQKGLIRVVADSPRDKFKRK